MAETTRTTVYLAGGMKSNWQDRVIAACPGFAFSDPRTHGLTEEKEYTAWDLQAITDCDLVFAYMDSDNPSGFGLSLEVGFAYGIGRPIFYVCEDGSERQKRFGMVRACASEVFDSLDAAIAALRDWTPAEAPILAASPYCPECGQMDGGTL
jgi:nucleoside 2-deoxyribosyltransferase